MPNSEQPLIMKKALLAILAIAILASCNETGGNDTPAVDPSNTNANTWHGAKYATRIRIVPTNTATGTKMLPAILPDKLTVCDGKESYPADHLIAPAPMQSGSGFDAVISIH